MRDRQLRDSDGKFKDGGLDPAGIRQRWARTVLGGRHLHRGDSEPLDPRVRASLHVLADPDRIDRHLPDLDREFRSPLLRSDRRKELAKAGHDVPERLNAERRRVALAEIAIHAAQMVDSDPATVANNAAARVVAAVERERGPSPEPLADHAGDGESDGEAAARLAGAGEPRRMEARAALAHLYHRVDPDRRALIAAMEASIRENGRVVYSFVSDQLNTSPRTVRRRKRDLAGG